jgi:predicted ATPase
LALQGFADRAMEALQQARTRVSMAPSATNQSYMHILCAHVQMSLAHSAGVANDATALAEVAAKYKLPMMKASASCALAWVALQQQRPHDAMMKFDDGLARLAESGTVNLVLPFRIGRALALAACDRTVEAKHAVEQAIADSSRTGERWCAAELLRVRGELALMGANPAMALAAESFGGAIDLARHQKAKLWELRAAVSFARLLMTQGRRSEALGLLAPVYGTFTEGFETADLVQAREILEPGHRQTQGTATQV